jgi:hypothetical protein
MPAGQDELVAGGYARLVDGGKISTSRSCIAAAGSRRWCRPQPRLKRNHSLTCHSAGPAGALLTSGQPRNQNWVREKNIGRPELFQDATTRPRSLGSAHTSNAIVQATAAQNTKSPRITCG